MRVQPQVSTNVSKALKSLARDRVYLDWNATAPLRREAREAMAAAWDLSGNPSSVHAEGRAARRLVEDARAAVASALNADPRHVVFSSGGTEANALALAPGLHRNGQAVERLIVSSIEHASVLAGGRFTGADITMVGVSDSGVLDLAGLAAALEGPPALVSIMLANNETGALQPVAEATTIVHAAGGLMHVDAVQAFGKIPIDIKALDADLISISAHKIGGPKGVGALVLAESVAGLDALIRGGGQELGRRAGTENVAGIAGFGAAVKATMAGLKADRALVEKLRFRLEDGLRQTGDLFVVAENVPRLPNTVLFAVPRLRAETAVIGFDLEGIAVSSGSACSSGKVQPSHVLQAMGYGPDLARAGVRLSLGWSTTDDEVDRAVEAWRKLSGALLKQDDETQLERF